MACQLGGSRENCVGFCRLHRCYITANQVKRRKCLKKQCGALRRLNHPYWARKDTIKQIRKAKMKGGKA